MIIWLAIHPLHFLFCCVCLFVFLFCFVFLKQAEHLIDHFTQCPNVLLPQIHKGDPTQTSYTAPCKGVDSYGAQIRGLRVHADHTRKNKCIHDLCGKWRRFWDLPCISLAATQFEQLSIYIVKIHGVAMLLTFVN